MKEYNIKITDNGIYINGELQYFAHNMDIDKNDDFNKKAILAIANAMGYEPQFLFEEMADSLEEMLDDEKEIELPNEAIVELSELDCCLNDEEEIKDCVVDFLTDEFGFCIRRCDISLEDEGLAKVTNIDWDTED